MKIPNILYIFAQLFHPDALDNGCTVEDVLCEFTIKYGNGSMRKVQKLMAESLASGDINIMEDLWQTADSGIDFEDATDEFFQKVVDFDLSEYTGVSGIKWKLFLLRMFSIRKW